MCVNNHFRSYCAYPIRKGVVYTIDGFYKCACGSNQVTLVEKPSAIDMNCRCNRISYRRQSYYEWRFIPFEYFENIIEFSSDKKEKLEEVNALELELKKEEVYKLINSMKPDIRTVLCEEWKDYYSN
jgi:hypothetical protein